MPSMHKNRVREASESSYASGVRIARRGVVLPALVVVVATLAACVQGVPLSSGTASTAASEGPELSFIEGVSAPEDLLALPGTDWVVTSGMAHGDSAGALGVVESATGRVEELWPASGTLVAPDETYSDCSEPPIVDTFSPHGINLAKDDAGSLTLYVVNHGERESVEVFAVDTEGRVPVATWTGCVLLPPHVSGNGVVALPDGSLVITNMYDPAAPDPVAALFADESSGDVRIWDSAAGWSVLPGTDWSGPNGVVASSDGQTLYIATWVGRSIMRVSLVDGSVESLADVPFLPDNLRWSAAGRLLVTGQDFAGLAAVHECALGAGEVCPAGFTVLEVDPDSGEVTTVFATDTTEFIYPTVAASVGDEIWVGTLAVDRIARVQNLGASVAAG